MISRYLSIILSSNIVAEKVTMKVFENHQEIKIKLRDVHREIQSVKGLLERVISNNKDLSVAAKGDYFKLPLDSEEELIENESILEDSSKIAILVRNLKLHTQFVKLIIVNVQARELSSVGGDTQQKNILYMMKKLMTKKLSLQYSSRGHKNKKNFSALKACSAVIGKFYK